MNSIATPVPCPHTSNAVYIMPEVLMNKLCDVAAILEPDKPNIVAITETFLGEEIIDSGIVDNT